MPCVLVSASLSSFIYFILTTGYLLESRSFHFHSLLLLSFAARHQSRSALDCCPIAWRKSLDQWQSSDRCRGRQAFIRHQVVSGQEIRILVICLLSRSHFDFLIFSFDRRLFIYILVKKTNNANSHCFYSFVLPTFQSIFDVCILCSYRACVL